MTVGIGTDLIEVARVARAYQRESFRRRVFTQEEQRLIGERMQRAAGNFAVKEAVVKALGTGFGRISPIEIEVLREPSGRPYVVLYGEAKQECDRQGIRRILVSISDTKDYAVAYATAEDAART